LNGLAEVKVAGNRRPPIANKQTDEVSNCKDYNSDSEVGRDLHFLQLLDTRMPEQ
jgi:hypothetical protein